MYVFPGKAFNYLVHFMAGADPVAPVSATFRVIDANGIVVPVTSIAVDGDQLEAWITIPAQHHTLNAGQKFRQFRIEIAHMMNGITFEQHYTYFIIPDLMLAFDGYTVRSLVGLSETELPDRDIDFARAYIDLAGGEYADAFLAALDSTNDSLVASAKQLILYHALITLLPTLRLKTLKSIESETSKLTRVANDATFEGIERGIRERYNMYLAAIKIAAGIATSGTTTLLILSNPTDVITGV